MSTDYTFDTLLEYAIFKYHWDKIPEDMDNAPMLQRLVVYIAALDNIVMHGLQSDDEYTQICALYAALKTAYKSIYDAYIDYATHKTTIEPETLDLTAFEFYKPCMEFIERAGGVPRLNVYKSLESAQRRYGGWNQFSASNIYSIEDAYCNACACVPWSLCDLIPYLEAKESLQPVEEELIKLRHESIPGPVDAPVTVLLQYKDMSFMYDSAGNVDYYGGSCFVFGASRADVELGAKCKRVLRELREEAEGVFPYTYLLIKQRYEFMEVHDGDDAEGIECRVMTDEPKAETQ